MSFIDDIVAAQSSSDELECLNEANASPKVLEIDSIISNLNNNWHPTGYYSSSDVQAILDVFATQAADAGAALADAPLSTGDAEASKERAFNDVFRVYVDQSQNYVRAVEQAKASGVDVINAPGLKHWVIASMKSISAAYVTAAVLQCRQGWIMSVLDRASRGMAAIGEVAWGVLGVVYDVGKGAVQAVEAGLGLAATLLKHTKWLLIIGVSGIAIYAGLQLYRKRFPHGLPELPEAWKLPD